MLIDSHTHIYDEEYADRYTEGLSALLEDDHASDVKKHVFVGTNPQNSELAFITSSKYDDTICSLCVHPEHTTEYTEADLDNIFAKFEKLIIEDKNLKIRAIGECGLDYYYHQDPSVHQKQKELLIRHLKLAQKHNKALIFHVREAFDDFFEILDKVYGTEPINGIVHSFSDSLANLQKATSRGLKIGVNGIMTFTKKPDQIEAYSSLELGDIVLETDAPYLTPAPHRGTINKGKYLWHIARKLSEYMSTDISSLEEASTNNCFKIFGKW